MAGGACKPSPCSAQLLPEGFGAEGFLFMVQPFKRPLRRRGGGRRTWQVAGGAACKPVLSRCRPEAVLSCCRPEVSGVWAVGCK